MDTSIFFGGWPSLARILVVGSAAYVALIALLRIGGKRTLARMNAYDFVITVSFGSTLATTLLSKDTALAEGVLALALLVALQYAVAWTGTRSERVRKLVRNEPALIVWDGSPIEDRMRQERVAADDVLAAARANGVPSLDDVGAAVLETDGSISIIDRRHGRPRGRLTPLGHLRLQAANGGDS